MTRPAALLAVTLCNSAKNLAARRRCKPSFVGRQAQRRWLMVAGDRVKADRGARMNG